MSEYCSAYYYLLFFFANNLFISDSAALPQPLHLQIKAGQTFSSSQASKLVSTFLSNDILAGSGGATIRASLERLLEGLKEEEKELELKRINGNGDVNKSSKKRRQSENGINGEVKKSKKSKSG